MIAGLNYFEVQTLRADRARRQRRERIAIRVAVCILLAAVALVILLCVTSVARAATDTPPARRPVSMRSCRWVPGTPSILLRCQPQGQPKTR
jgi:hypothetical protein